MNYELSFQGYPGYVEATLSFDGDVIDTATLLRDGAAARKWAKKAAAKHRADTVKETHFEEQVIRGNSSFAL